MSAVGMLGGQWHQLPMFMSASEIRTSSNLGDQRFHDAQAWGESLLQKKLRETHESERMTGGLTLHENIRRNGVQSPLEINHTKDGSGGNGLPNLYEGHHRLAAALDTRPHDLLPVTHIDFDQRAKLQSKQFSQPLPSARPLAASSSIALGG